MMLWRMRSAAVGVALLATSSPTLALNPSLDVSQYVHTAWRNREGFSKGAITAIAQTRDGYLWLGTEFGLLRFDGVRTVEWQPPRDQPLPSTYITGLLGARDGALWIATFSGLVSWNGRTLTRYAEVDGTVHKLLEDQHGAVWASRFALGRFWLCSIREGRTQCSDDDRVRIFAELFEDKAGRLWVGAGDGVWRWSEPRTPYLWGTEPNGIQGIAESDDGRLLMAVRGEVKRLVGDRVETAFRLPESVRRFQARGLVRDRDGGLWMGTTGGGLVHVHHGKIDVFTHADGLSNDSVGGIYEDREGNIWVRTDGGIDQFRNPTVATVSSDQGLSNDRVISLAARKDGSVWIGTFEGLNRWQDGVARQISGPGMPEHGVQYLHEDGRGRLWITTGLGLGYLEATRFVPVHATSSLTNAAGITEDTQGTIWAAIREIGLIEVTSAGRVQERSLSSLGQSGWLSTILADPSRGGVWLGFADGGVAYLNGDRIQKSYGAADGLAPGRVTAFWFDRDSALWIASEGGLSRLKNGRIVTLGSANGLPCESLQWVMQDESGAFWMNASCGLMRVPRADMDGAQTVHATVFDQSDGVRSSRTIGSYGPHVVRAADGRLWFTSGMEGVGIVDPTHLSTNTLAPPVHIEQVTADHVPHDMTSTDGVLRLPSLVRDLEIDYTALSFVAPEKVRFRYQLEGFDGGWQEANGRRQAFYTNLSPGKYRFHVIASSAGGAWNESGAALDLVIPPAYYQTNWFVALSVGLILALVWTAHRIRLGIVERHEQEITALNERLMKAQEQERMRIAGELHDGVMQEMLAVTMMLGTAKRRIVAQPDATAAIDKIQDKMIRVGADIRRLSHDLHPPILHEAGLPRAVQAHCEQFSASSGIQVSCEADESVQELSAGAALALFRIVQEALGNAAKHARARNIAVRLTRSNGMVAVAVSDDGVGFDSDRPGSSRGLGLIMIRERATQLNGTFDLDSAPGRGTTISVAIPFR
jgi:signal transduction histidine kinase/ligand-binding sensor domain-containing protein